MPLLAAATILWAVTDSPWATALAVLSAVGCLMFLTSSDERTDRLVRILRWRH